MGPWTCPPSALGILSGLEGLPACACWDEELEHFTHLPERKSRGRRWRHLVFGIAFVDATSPWVQLGVATAVSAVAPTIIAGVAVSGPGRATTIPWRSDPSNHAWRFCSSFWLPALMGYSWSWKETLYRCLTAGFAREWPVRNGCLRAKTRISFGCRRWRECHAVAWASNSLSWHSSPPSCYQGSVWFCADSTQKSTAWRECCYYC